MGLKKTLFISMATLSLSAPYKQSGLLFSPEELSQGYLYGINLKTSTGEQIPHSMWEIWIRGAQEEVEKKLSIKFKLQKIQESRDYHYTDFYNWNFIRTGYPVRKVCNLKGFFGEQEQISFPDNWISTKKDNKERYWRQFTLVPNQGGVIQGIGFYFPGFAPHFGRRINIPNFWRYEYITGFQKIPADLLNIVGMLASLNLFYIAGDISVPGGLGSHSLSIDGLSQSISALRYKDRIESYKNQIENTWKSVRSYYKGISISVL